MKAVLILERELDRLYQVPLDEFTAARNALSAALKKAGDAESAKRVKAIKKPTTSAWAVNQLFWSKRTLFDALIGAGDRSRAALSLGGAEAEQALGARDDAVAGAVRAAREIVEASGLVVNETLLRRLRATLTALAAYGSANPRPADGRLGVDLDPPGLSVFAGLVPPPPPSEPAPSGTPPAPEPDAVAEKRRRELEDARTGVAAAEERVAAAAANLERIEQRAKDAESALAAARADLEQKRERLTALEHGV